MLFRSPLPAGPILFVANQVALDFINTAYGTDHQQCDCLVDDQSVLGWLTEAQLISEPLDTLPEGLLELARALRAEARALVVAAKAGRAAPATVVNQVLREGRPLQTLEWDPATLAFKLVRRREHSDAAALLEPVARSLVDLLANQDLHLVRECEAHDCTLFFHDLTKSHRRRWCSMASCGNRVKAAAHRARKQAG